MGQYERSSSEEPLHAACLWTDRHMSPHKSFRNVFERSLRP